MFRVDDRDIRFNLYEYVDLQGVLELPAFAELDRDTVDVLLANAFKMARELLAPLNAPGDREGCRIDEHGRVFVPKGYKEAYDAFCEAGWIGIADPVEHGGTGAPQLVRLAAWEAFCGACCSLMMYPGLTQAAASLIIDEGSDDQKKVFLEKMLSGRWGGTMCLTEPGAGSAVGDNKTTAVKVRDGFYRIRGQKIFISAGDNDLVENNVHLVLARTPGAPPGVKGLSLFIVPARRVNPDGSPGEPNDVACTGIEHKMGIRGSATCTVAFGDNDRCEGWLIGTEGSGIQIMFHMMNEARLGVGLLSVSVGAAAHNEALDYARERIQGVDMRRFKDPDAPRVPIIEHPDVRRMLMLQRAYVHGIRGLMYRVVRMADVGRHGAGEEKDRAVALIELLTPLCKGYCSDLAVEITSLAVQILGGYGYCAEYPVEQYMRDARIFPIYEGTNGIQAMDLVGRKLGMKGGAVFMAFNAEMQAFLERAKAHPSIRDCVDEVEKSVEDLQSLAMTFMGKNMSGEVLYVLQQATPFLRFMGNLALAWVLGEQALIASDKLDAIFAAKGAATPEARKALVREDADAAFYDGKVKTARFFLRNLLPENRSLARAMTSDDTSIMDVVL